MNEHVWKFGVDDIEVHLDELVDKKFVINNGDGIYSLCSDGLLL